jgi:hypothetical protein
VPFGPHDFATEGERLEVCGPTPVTDMDGHVLPAWRAGATGAMIGPVPRATATSR